MRGKWQPIGIGWLNTSLPRPKVADHIGWCPCLWNYGPGPHRGKRNTQRHPARKQHAPKNSSTRMSLWEFENRMFHDCSIMRKSNVGWHVCVCVPYIFANARLNITCNIYKSNQVNKLESARTCPTLLSLKNEFIAWLVSCFNMF